MTDTKKTMAQIAALAGLGIDGAAGDLIADAVALLAQRLPTKGAGGEAPEPQTEPAQQGPALRRLLALTGWATGVKGSTAWVGPSYAHRWASVCLDTGHANLWDRGSNNLVTGWSWRPIAGDPMEVACTEILRRHDEGIDPLPILKVPKLAIDQRIGKWCRDSDDGCGLVVSLPNGSGWVYVINKDGGVCVLRPDATITTPPDPIPEPCRPAWEAFRALESRDG